MSTLLIRCLLVALCMSFQTISLFGMLHGTIATQSAREELLGQVVQNAFQTRVDDPSEFLDLVFSQFNRVASPSAEHVNLLFHSNNVYK